MDIVKVYWYGLGGLQKIVKGSKDLWVCLEATILKVNPSTVTQTGRLAFIHLPSYFKYLSVVELRDSDVISKVLSYKCRGNKIN